MNYQSFFSRAASRMQESAIRKMGMLGSRGSDLISFAPGYPDPASFPWDELAAIAAEGFKAREASALQYGPTRGFGPMVDAIGGVMAARHIPSKTDETLVTTGSQQGLDLIGRVLIDPGDVILVELPTYTGAITAFSNVQAQLVGVRQGADGIDLDDLEAVVARLRASGRRIRFLYVVPNFQNPTGLLIGREKRLALLAAAARHDFLIVEDDPYGELYFTDVAGPADTRPIKADDSDGRVIYLSSFSKTLVPGLRVGWLVAPATLVAKLEIAKQAADICTGALDQYMVWRSMTGGVLDAQGPRLRALYQQKRMAMEHGLRRELDDVLTWPEPRGGFFLWASLPTDMDAEALLERAIARRVLFVIGTAFYVDGGGRNAMRLSFAQPSAARIEEGVERLATAVRDVLGTPERQGGVKGASVVSVPGTS